MSVSPVLLAFGKLALTFGVILLGIRFRLGLWLSILAGSLVVAFTCSLSPLTWVIVVLTTLVQKDFIMLAVMIFLILTLSGVQEASGQNRRLVAGLERFVRWPRLRLIIFPALIGLLPMPGGALFSCPMLHAASKALPVDGKRKVLLNYWFRHIWELACPLYPGYILASSLLGVPLFALASHTFPLVFFSMFTGWLFFLRDLAGMREMKDAAAPPADGDAASLFRVLLDLLPIVITLAGAAAFSFLFDFFHPGLPSQFAFAAALVCAVGAALWQGRGQIQGSLRRLFLSGNTGRLLLLIFAIFAFKDIIAASDIVSDISALGAGRYALYSLFFLLPFICGALMGIMVGYVGAALPILITLAGQTGLREEMLPLIVLALVGGNSGQLITPLHVCLVVTCEYFRVTLAEIWRRLAGAVALQIVGSLVWILVLFAFGSGF